MEDKKISSNSLNKIALKAGVFYIFAQLFIRGISFLTTPLYTRLLTTAQYGQIKVYESWLLIAVPVMSLCLWKSVDRAKYDLDEQGYNAYVSSNHTLSYISIGICFLVCLAFKDQVEAFCHMDDVMFYVGFGYVFAYSSILFMQRREKQMMRYKASTLITLLTVVPATVISLAWMYWGKQIGMQQELVHYRVISFYGIHIVGGIVVIVLLTLQGRKLVAKEFWKYGLLYSLPLIPEAISIQIMNQADKIMVQNMVSDEASGLIGLGTTVSFIIWILEDSVWNAWQPWLFEKISRRETKDVQEPWKVLMHGFGLISWCIVMLAPEIVLILGGSRYYSVIWLVTPMVTGTLFRFYSYSYTAIQNYHKKTEYVALGTLLAMMINVVLNYFCIRQFGYQAAAYTTAVSYFLLLLLQGWLELRITGQRIIPLGTTVKISLLYFAVNLISMASYLTPWYVRYLITAAGALLAARKILPQFLKVMKTTRKNKKQHMGEERDV